MNDLLLTIVIGGLLGFVSCIIFIFINIRNYRQIKSTMLSRINNAETMLNSQIAQLNTAELSMTEAGKELLALLKRDGVYVKSEAEAKLEQVANVKMEHRGASMSDLNVKAYNSISEISPEVWDGIAAGRGFQSHRWYTFGERVMADSQPTYLLVHYEGKPVAGAAFFKTHNEPLPLPSVARQFMVSILKRRPMLVCRSPLADTSALLLPDEPMRDELLKVIVNAAQEQLKKQHGSFLVFDSLLTEQLKYSGWTPNLEPVTSSEAGTFMSIQWENFEAYLASRKEQDDEYYKQSIKEAEENGLVLSKHASVSDIETALRLIQNLSIWHGSAPNPWIRGLLENFSMIDGTWLELHKEGKLVGCSAVLRDNGFQLTTAFGLEDDVPSGYFFLLHSALQEAFAHNIRLVRFGTGAYDIKRKLGIHLEDTNHAMVLSAGSPLGTKEKIM